MSENYTYWRCLLNHGDGDFVIYTIPNSLGLTLELRWLPHKISEMFPTIDDGLTALYRLKAKVAMKSNDTITGAMSEFGPDIFANAYFSVDNTPSHVVRLSQMTVEIALIALDAMKRAYVLTGMSGFFWGCLTASGNLIWDGYTLTLGTFSISWWIELRCVAQNQYCCLFLSYNNKVIIKCSVFDRIVDALPQVGLLKFFDMAYTVATERLPDELGRADPIILSIESHCLETQVALSDSNLYLLLPDATMRVIRPKEQEGKCWLLRIKLTLL